MWNKTIWLKCGIFGKETKRERKAGFTLWTLSSTRPKFWTISLGNHFCNNSPNVFEQGYYQVLI